MYKVSVIIPVYNGELWIKRCLDSIQSQTIFEDIEVIIIDDGSTDSSGKIIDEYIKNFNQMKVYHIKNSGVSNARNVGLNNANGEYVSFIDVDDYIDIDYFEYLLSEANDVYDIIACGFKAEYDNSIVEHSCKEKIVYSKEHIIKAFLAGCNLDVNVWGKIYKKSIINDVSFDNRFAVAEDKLFMYECLKRIDTIAILPKCKYHYQISNESAMRREFNVKKLDGLTITKIIDDDIKEHYKDLSDYSESLLVDVKCRACVILLENNVPIEYKKLYKEMLKEIRRYSIVKKYKYSSKKHFWAFVVTRITPKLSKIIKMRFKLQYKA